MFNVTDFVKACQGKQPTAIKELLTNALRDPASISKALAAFGEGKDVSKGGMGDLLIHQAPDLTILKAAVPAKFKSAPHNHLMWAVIGVYDGQENNYFYRRTETGLESSGGKQVYQSNVLMLGENVIHAIENPLDRPLYAIHVYGGDLPGAPRRMWNPFTMQEEAFDFQTMREYAQKMLEQQ
jgi:predicted metal-dependent enzyme (double-stranded beta helix superfamily)